MSEQRIDLATPTSGEIDAAERVLAEASGMKADGYFRTLGVAVLEAAKDAALREFVAKPLDDACFEQQGLGGGRR